MSDQHFKKYTSFVLKVYLKYTNQKYTLSTQLLGTPKKYTESIPQRKNT